MALFTINGFTITSLERIMVFERAISRCLCILDEVQKSQIQNTEDTTNITGKGGRVLFQIKKNKGVTVTGDSAYISGGLMEAQTGTEETYGKLNVRYTDVIAVTDDVVKQKKITTTYKAVGTAGAEIVDVRVMSDNGGLIKNEYKQGTEAGANAYAYNPQSKELTLPTDITLTAGQQIAVIYDREVEGASVANKSDVFGKTVELFIDCIGKDVCDNEYLCQFHIFRTQMSGEFTVELGGEQVIHSFSATSLVDNCAKSSTNKMWNFVVYKDEDAAS